MFSNTFSFENYWKFNFLKNEKSHKVQSYQIPLPKKEYLNNDDLKVRETNFYS